MLDAQRLLLIGCGKMGGALLQSWLRQGADPHQIVVVEPSPLTLSPAADPALTHRANLAELDPNFIPNIVVLALKPQIMDQAAPALARFKGPDCAYISIAAGKTIAAYEQYFGADAAIVRAMPNTPAAVAKGMSVLCANPQVSAAQRALATKLMAAVGETAWIEDEALMDAVTAVSGSGPAYVFLLIECLAKAGEQAGLPQQIAAMLAMQTVAGAGALAQAADEDPSQLRVNVTSPGGTTAAALSVLMAEPGLQDLLNRAVAAATQRGKELG